MLYLNRISMLCRFDSAKLRTFQKRCYRKQLIFVVFVFILDLSQLHQASKP